MGKLWKKQCKRVSKSTFKSCVRKSGKVKSCGFKQSFFKVLKVVLNKNLYLLNRDVLHSFHIAYYYN